MRAILTEEFEVDEKIMVGHRFHCPCISWTEDKNGYSCGIRVLKSEDSGKDVSCQGFRHKLCPLKNGALLIIPEEVNVSQR